MVIKITDTEITCDHSNFYYAKRIASNGIATGGKCCTSCGCFIPVKKTYSKKWDSVPIWDRSFRDSWYKQLDDWHEKRRQRQKQIWFNAHTEYLKSDIWLRKRDLVMRRSNNKCEAKLIGCLGIASQVHHLSYRNWRQEPLGDLQAICSFCHSYITSVSRSGIL